MDQLNAQGKLDYRIVRWAPEVYQNLFEIRARINESFRNNNNNYGKLASDQELTRLVSEAIAEIKVWLRDWEKWR
jgi:hypothetical protein